MAEFSLNIDEIENEVNDTLKKEQVKLENSNLKSQAENNAVAIFDADLNNPTERENIMKPLEDFGLNDMARSSQRNKLLSTRFIDLEKGGTESENIGDKLSELNLQMKDLDPSKVDFTKKGVSEISSIRSENTSQDIKKLKQLFPRLLLHLTTAVKYFKMTIQPLLQKRII